MTEFAVKSTKTVLKVKPGHRPGQCMDVTQLPGDPGQKCHARLTKFTQFQC